MQTPYLHVCYSLCHSAHIPQHIANLSSHPYPQWIWLVCDTVQLLCRVESRRVTLSLSAMCVIPPCLMNINGFSFAWPSPGVENGLMHSAWIDFYASKCLRCRGQINLLSWHQLRCGCGFHRHVLATFPDIDRTSTFLYDGVISSPLLQTAWAQSCTFRVKTLVWPSGLVVSM